MKKQLVELFAYYLLLEEEQNKLIKKLFNRTELFEGKYMIDFNNELFKFVAGKLNRYANENNKIRNLLDREEIIELNKKIYYAKEEL